jgi:predicted RNase H-like nuclease
VAITPGRRRRIDWHVTETIREAAALTAHCEVVAIDIPIGLLDAATPGGRPCDQEARRLLPAGWKSAVFTPPARAVLSAATYEEGLELNRQSSPHRLGFSIQAWNIVEKIREVDELVRVDQPLGWHETFPELAFIEINGGVPLANKKKTVEGRQERRRLLTRIFGALRPSPEVLFPRSKVHLDDVWDALVCCHVARRIASGAALRVGLAHERDGAGLAMVIHY